MLTIPLALHSVACGGCAGLPAQPVTRPVGTITNADKSLGQRGYESILARWTELTGGATTYTKQEYDRQRQIFDALTMSMAAQDVRNIAAYIRSRQNPDTSRFDRWMGEHLMRRALAQTDTELMEEIFSEVYVTAVDGRYTEWTLEKRTGQSIRILCRAYHDAGAPERSRIVMSLQRALPQVDRSVVSDDDYIGLCWQYYTKNAAGVRINGSYQLPLRPGMTATEFSTQAASQPSLGLFTPK